ncbi:2-succinyl-5-enolpyruvyl-6-hydroxy-3-cyclohexene-1-carboxylic-acid synthase [Brevibacterium luteolum]|uniref:2-succinyl-5-enolpyruvyl-6-hydroxy-3-cyclohexene-1-carboxylate synthase n=1 Tax=Brevibacterium luteolum TaxID=199591 RepID=A0A849AQ63_9MICO|nr:2-succinyl-5-enolpyruvyl-6-hydroxy-3-cyclohexene-1-carboxylic-acid synthase [Brevibacterium luteolum]MBM7530682.1 2-succinyl-5-enolpyruvyl-6-hydroxy-3-cyclohexene-1-carboxylate synthase [Brevibacterium luteolum]NNG78070.1 2-succinyl-5-enolpyruvyl-6-hydroxy-3-cyclohexene-1-carboxylic-acid synthase [Brevibacterium luteolum]
MNTSPDQQLQPSTAVARAVVRALTAAGVRDVVICPGSRSAPLTYALAQAAAAGRIDTFVRIDERSAAFLALGLAKGHRIAGHPRPVAVVTTSGSAVANLHPAFVEAAYAHLPLIALTADRPARLRGTGANQTLDAQATMLPEALTGCDIPVGAADAEAIAGRCLAAACGAGPGGQPGPVQINVQFDVPLVPTAAEAADDWTAELTCPPVPAPIPVTEIVETAQITAAAEALTAAAGETIVLGGDVHGFPLAGLAAALEATGVPILAEPSCPLVDSSAAVPTHPQVLEAHPQLLDECRRVVVIGKPTLFRPDAKLLASDRQIIRIPAGAEVGLASALDAERDAECDAERPAGAGRWSGRWIEAGRKLTGTGGKRAEIVQAALTAAPDAVRPHVYAASSSAIRVIAETIHAVPVDRRAQVHASRGLAGIDGLISTATGFSRALDPAVPVRLIIGDLAMLHEIGGLLREAGEELPALQIIVLNDDGGQIFAGLEHGQDHLVPYFERYFATPHGRGFATLAAGYGWPHTQVDSAEALARVLAAGEPGIIEVPLPSVASPAAS